MNSSQDTHFGNLEARDILIEELLLDKENPRLPADLRGEDDQSKLAIDMAAVFDALSVARSIARFGYYPWEALVVVPVGDKYVVVEGNRRLTALKGLLDPGLRSRFENSNAWEEATGLAGGNLPTAAPCVVVDDRTRATPALGYRHISGIKPWEPQMQARFVAALVDQEHRSFDEVAELVGQTDQWVQDTYSTFKVFETATDVGVDTTSASNSYSLLTVAMSTRELREHIGATRDIEEGSSAIDDPDSETLGELFEWVFGSDSEDSVASESREIRALARVIGKPSGLQAIRSGSSLEEAQQQIDDDEHDPADIVRRDLLKAEQALNRVQIDPEAILIDDQIRDAVDAIAEQTQRLLNAIDAEE